jgi:hypothetical protein
MVKVRGRQHYTGCANCDVVTNSSSKAAPASAAGVIDRRRGRMVCVREDHTGAEVELKTPITT